MKDKKNKEQYNKKANKQNKNVNLKADYKWIITITLTAFMITFIMSIFSESALKDINLTLSILIVLIFIVLGIVFDMVGISVTVADKKVFHSMAAKKVSGAKTALKLIANNSKVSSFCNDVIGDICGILSGTAAGTIAILLANKLNFNIFYVSLIITSIIAALTIGGKALGKSIAINHSNNILYKFSCVIKVFTGEK
jgi:CBS domain containing-hemolysin-like protein